jgi:hypothetical protein
MANAIGAIDALCEPGWKEKVSLVELTFDLTGVTVEWLRRCIVTRAHKFAQRTDQFGRRTLYIGGKTSPWQLRIYDKADGVVRLELILRRPFLRKCGIDALRHLRKLRRMKLGSLLCLCRVSQAGLSEFANGLHFGAKTVLVNWLRDLTLQELKQRAAICGWTLPPSLIVQARQDRQLQEMHARLIL